MKANLLKLIMMFVMIISYSEGVFAQEKLVNRLTSTTEKSSQKVIPFKIETDFISGNSGCYTVNVRVYLVNLESGQKTLVVNDNVQVGDCETNRKINTSNPNACKAGYHPNGDYVFPNNTTNKYCLLDLLLDNEEVYNQYLKSVEETLENR
ncbi:MAG TPA: hypothetical protein VLZ11_05990 [Flavobacterium sp.]|nr:hypothetical protein [Flavobacterium sp.]